MKTGGYLFFLFAVLGNLVFFIKAYSKRSRAPVPHLTRVTFQKADGSVPGQEYGRQLGAIFPNRLYLIFRVLVWMNLVYFSWAQGADVFWLFDIFWVLLLLFGFCRSLFFLLWKCFSVEIYENAVVQVGYVRRKVFFLRELDFLRIFPGKDGTSECLFYKGTTPVLILSTKNLVFSDLSPVWRSYGEENPNVSGMEEKALSRKGF